MAHLVNMGTKKWRIAIEVGRDPRTGKRKRKYQTFHGTKKEAELEKLKMIKKYKDGAPTEEITTKDYLLKWLQEYAKKNLAASTYRDYKTIVKKHLIPAFNKLKLKDLHARHIIKYQNNKLENGRLDGKGGLSNRTVQYHHRILSQALKHAVSPYEYINYNPCQRITAPSPNPPEIQPLSHEQANILLDHIEYDKSFYTLIYLDLYTGLRRGELLALKWKDIDFDNLRLHIRRSTEVIRGTENSEGTIKYNKPKTESSIRTVDFDTDTAEVLMGYKNYMEGYNKAENLVFRLDNKKPMHPDYVTRRFRRKANKVGLDQVRFHDIRHTHATWLLQAGVNPKIVQERLGHYDITITLKIYSHVIPSMQKDAVEKLQKLKEKYD
jgi:integrase